MEVFKVTLIYSDTSGDSHFTERYYPLTDHGTIGALSEQVTVRTLRLRTVPSSYDFDFHCAPARQFIILLDGSIEIETSSGEKRVFNGGDIIQVEDTTGKGHRTRNLIAAVRHSVFVTYD